MDNSEPISDEGLMERLTTGDALALEGLYKRHRQMVYRVALRIIGDPQAAEEVLQDTFFQAWQKCLQFDSQQGSFIGWLLTITRHRAIDRARGDKRQVRCESLPENRDTISANTGPSVLERRIAHELVMAAFASLPEAKRSAIAQAYFEGFTCEEIASRTQIPLGTIKARIRSGLGGMKKTLMNPPQAAKSAEASAYPATLSDILITEQLYSRRCRQRNLNLENKALDCLAEALTASPTQLIDAFVRMPIDLCRAGSGGLSLLETTPAGERVFRWTNLSGTLAQYVGGTTPRNFSPCGVTLDCKAPQLFKYPSRYFDYFNKVDVPIVEGLVIPFHIGDKTEGTIWIASHDPATEFDLEDARIMTTLAEFAGSALHVCNHWLDGGAEPQTPQAAT